MTNNKTKIRKSYDKGILPKSRVQFNDSKIEYIDLSGISYEKLPEYFYAFTEAEKVSIENSKLTNIPDEIQELDNLNWLNISSNNFSEIPKSLSRLKKLKEIRIFGNKVDSKTPYELNGLENISQIEKLYIEWTNLKKVPDSLKYLTNLEKLELINCGQIRNIDVICNLSNLKEAHFNQIGIERIPKDIAQLKELEIFEISLYNDQDRLSNPILPETFAELKKLKKLIFHNCYLNASRLPEYISNIKNLEILEMLRTNLLLPRSIAGLSQLKELTIRENTALNALPEDIGQCKILKRIDIEDTAIEELPESITQLTNLEYLDLSYNEIKRLPENLGNLRKLEHLNLINNNIVYIPESIGDLSNLKGLSIMDQNAGYGNKVVDALPRSIVKLSKLQGTDLFRLEDSKKTPWIQEFLKTVKERRKEENTKKLSQVQ